MTQFNDKVKLLISLRHEYHELRKEIEDLEEEIASGMESSNMVISGIGMLQRKQKGTRTKWDHEAVFSALNRFVAVSPFTSERQEGMKQGVKLMQSLANPSWRVTKLREIDIDPDEYSHKEPGGYTVLITEGIQE